MKITSSIIPFVSAFLFSFMLFLACAAIPALAQEHDDEAAHEEEAAHDDDHEAMTTTIANSENSIESMKALVALLQQLVTLLTQQLALGGTYHDDDHVEVLTISAEVHGGRTHIHVYEPGKDEVGFFLDGIDVGDHDAVIDAIVAQTGLPEDAVHDATTFPAEEEHEHDEAEDLESMHIMTDGTIMSASGEEVEGATITDDGMIMLADGDLVEPEYDLR